MKILVTGGAGFIGSHVVDAYIRAGHSVVVVDDLSSGCKDNIHPEAVFYKQDICSDKLFEIFDKERPDVVNHHAAHVSVPMSVIKPLYDARVNIVGLLNVLQCSVATRVSKVIFISSGGSVYGEAREYPTTENCPHAPESVYAIHKSAGERYLDFYHKQHGLGYTILRYANVYGPRQMPSGEAGVISVFIDKLLRNETPVLNVFPDEPAGMIRDYVFVRDVVTANLLALDRGLNDVFNIGTGIETRTGHLLHTIAELMGKSITPKTAPARDGDIRRSLLDIHKAKELLGWSPEYSLSQGLSETILFHKNKQDRGNQ